MLVAVPMPGAMMDLVVLDQILPELSMMKPNRYDDTPTI